MVEIGIGPDLFSAGSFVLSWHGFFSFVAVAAAVYLVGRWAPTRGIDPDTVYSVAIWAIIGGVLGARLVHVVDERAFYQSNPGEIFAIWSGGIAVWGAILGGFVGGSVYALWAKHPVGILADLTAPVMLISQTIGRLGDVVNGEHCAKAADFFLGFTWTNPESDARICDNGVGVSVQPVILYEMIWNMIALVIVWRLRGRLRPDGMLFAVYLALYSVGRFAITFAREDKIWALGMQEAQYIALMVVAATGVLLLMKGRFKTAEEVAAEPHPVVRPSGTRAQRRRGR